MKSKPNNNKQDSNIPGSKFIFIPREIKKPRSKTSLKLQILLDNFSAVLCPENKTPITNAPSSPVRPKVLNTVIPKKRAMTNLVIRKIKD